MAQNNSDPLHASPARRWSNRILAASLFGILFFTLFPYWIDFSQKHSPGRSVFLLSRSLGFDGFLHTSLNALLFMPFGLALWQFFSTRKKSLLRSIAAALVAGVAVSYSIEILQLYMPSRDSAWDDVIANTLGTLIGTFLGAGVGNFIFRKLSECERHVERFLSLRKIFIAALIYFAAWLAISVPLQKKTRLDNWDPNSFLFVGYDARDDTRWSGSVSRIQLWDHALTADQAAAISKNADASAGIPSPLASYDLSHLPPIPDKNGALPNLVLNPPSSLPATTRLVRKLEAGPVFMSDGTVPSLSANVRRTNQFAVLIRCVPLSGNDSDGAIFAIANPVGKVNFAIRQINSTVGISFRTALESRKAFLSWQTDDVFTANVGRSFLYSYDGARGSLHIDGNGVPESDYLSPGAGLVSEFIRIKTSELVAYAVLYESLVFIPIGFLLGLAGRDIANHSTLYKVGIAACIILPAILLETALVSVSGRPPSMLQLFTSIGLTIAGMIWINLDSPASSSEALYN
jgi:glycopeptide antibiotics resistance protein